MSDRTPEERYRIYALSPANELVLVATTPDPAGVGVALVQLGEEKQWSKDDRIGLLDTLGNPQIPGRWLINPYARPADPTRIVRGSHQEEES